jgi:drug/metabolite transporter (DMT)-like permease
MAASGPQAERVQHPVAATAWMLGAITSFSIMAVSAREIGGVHDTFEIMAFRSLVGLGLVVAFAALRGRLGEISSARLGTHALRNVIHFTGQNLWFLALTMIPLAQVFALEFTSPVWVLILSPLLLGERITRVRAVAAGLGFAGILLVAQPEFGNLDPGVAAAAASALCFALTNITTRALTRHEGIVSILFWLTLMQLIMGCASVAWDGAVTWPDTTTLPWLILIGIAGVAAHLCLTSALSLAPASFVMPIDFARLPVIALVGMLVYGEALDPLVLVGAVVIFAGNYLNVREGAAAARG